MTRAVLETIVLNVALAVALFLPAGRIAWPMAWVVLLFYVALSIAGLLVLSPELIAERSRLPPDSMALDLLIAGLAFGLLVPATLIVCGLDVRWQGSPAIPGWLRAVALVVFVVGYALSFWAVCSNPFFSAVVRVQRERGHQVIVAGPYAFIRHPGYAGPMLAGLCLPIALGSVWGLVPALLGCVFLVLRIGLEERVLVSQLPGYREYAQRVRSRLIPRVW